MTKPLQAPIYTIQITGYYLSQYPCQTNPSANQPSAQVIAYMTLMGSPDDDNNPKTTPSGFNFNINFYPDGTPGLSAPLLILGENRLVMDMYYSQLADILRMLRDDQVQCYATYTSGPPAHAEVFGEMPSPS
jgi:hypothetical protein